MLKKLFTAILLLALSTQISLAQNCSSCFTATPDSISNSVYNLDASCSTPSNGFFNYAWYVDNQYYTTWFFPQMQIPFYNYGNHTISLVLLGQNCSDTSTQTITITPTCNAQFISYGVGAGAYYFYQNNPTSNTANYTWDFGDGNTQTGTTVGYHIYTSSGTYNACLTLTDTSAGGCADKVCQSVLVNINYPCIASLSQYVDNFTGFLSADGYSSQFNNLNYGFKFYLNGVLAQQGTNPTFYTQLTSIGTYTLSMVLTDSNGNNPCDSTTQIVSYTGGVNNGGCSPCFNATYFNAAYDSIMVDANCSSIPIGGSIAWNVNGVNLSNNASVQFLGFPTYGTQVITLFVKDSTGAICDSNSSYVYTYPPPCSSCLTVSQVGGSTSDYYFDGSCSSTATSGSVYSWFVDNNFITSTTNPQFVYSFTQSGTYNVCLQIADAFGGACSQSCTSVTVNTPTVTLYDISGTIYKFDNTFAYTSPGNNEAKVYLIKLMTGGQLEAIDSTTTNGFGQYSFSNKPIDDYRIKVALNPSSPDYAYNIPSYFQTGMMWYDAQVVTLFGNTYNKDIYMNYGINSGGNGFISGNVFAGANKQRSNVDVTLILMDVSTNKPVAYSKTGANGYYSFANIPNGTYKVYGELLNRASIPENITIGAQNTFTGKNFIYNSNVIQPTNIALSVKDVLLDDKLNVVPNPATENFNVRNKNHPTTIKIFDLIGRQMATFDMKANEEKNIDCSQWTKGIYLIEEIVGSKKSIQKLLLK